MYISAPYGYSSFLSSLSDVNYPLYQIEEKTLSALNKFKKFRKGPSTTGGNRYALLAESTSTKKKKRKEKHNKNILNVSVIDPQNIKNNRNYPEFIVLEACDRNEPLTQ